jgi:hypothetical protein
MRLALVVALLLAVAGAVAVSTSGLACMLEDLEDLPSASVPSEPRVAPLPTAPEVDVTEVPAHPFLTR